MDQHENQVPIQPRKLLLSVAGPLEGQRDGCAYLRHGVLNESQGHREKIHQSEEKIHFQQETKLHCQISDG